MNKNVPSKKTVTVFLLLMATGFGLLANSASFIRVFMSNKVVRAIENGKFSILAGSSRLIGIF